MNIPAKDWFSGNLAAEVSQRARVDADGGSVGDQESSTLDRLEESEENSETVLSVVTMLKILGMYISVTGFHKLQESHK